MVKKNCFSFLSPGSSIIILHFGFISPGEMEPIFPHSLCLLLKGLFSQGRNENREEQFPGLRNNHIGERVAGNEA